MCKTPMKTRTLSLTTSMSAGVLSLQENFKELAFSYKKSYVNKVNFTEIPQIFSFPGENNK